MQCVAQMPIQNARFVTSTSTTMLLVERTKGKIVSSSYMTTQCLDWQGMISNSRTQKNGIGQTRQLKKWGRTKISLKNSVKTKKTDIFFGCLLVWLYLFVCLFACLLVWLNSFFFLQFFNTGRAILNNFVQDITSSLKKIVWREEWPLQLQLCLWL